jgi:enoyl-CoA hydratase/carnithine racemase
MAVDDLKLIRVTIEGHVATVTMDNPPVNAQSRPFTEEMVLAFDRISEMPEVRCAVLTGAGRIFSAGADIKARAAAAATLAPGDALAHLRRGRESFNAIYECRKPVIAALNGPALGAGLALAASCDILVAAETASLGLPEVDAGLLGGGRHAMRLFGHSRTRRMMFTGYRVPAPELLRLGIVEACVPLDQLMSVALGLARDISGAAVRDSPAKASNCPCRKAASQADHRDGQRGSLWRWPRPNARLRPTGWRCLRKVWNHLRQDGPFRRFRHLVFADQDPRPD